MTLVLLKLAKLLQLPISSAMMDIWLTVVSYIRCCSRSRTRG